MEAEDAWFERGLLDEFCHIAERAVFTGAIFYVVSMSMKTVIPLRITSIVSTSCLLGLIDTGALTPAILLYALLLPVHSIRLYQMLELIKKVRAAAGADLSMNWLRPYMKKRRHRAGDILFRKGNSATEMFLRQKAGTG